MGPVQAWIEARVAETLAEADDEAPDLAVVLSIYLFDRLAREFGLEPEAIIHARSGREIPIYEHPLFPPGQMVIGTYSRARIAAELAGEDLLPFTVPLAAAEEMNLN